MVDVTLHLSILFAIPGILLIRALQCQYNYSQTFAALDSNAPLMWYDILSRGTQGMHMVDGWYGKYVLPAVKVLVMEVICYLCFAVVRMACHYIEPPNGTFKRVVNWVFAIVLYFQTWLMLVYVMLVCVWATLAAVLSPKEYLVYGVAIGVGVVVITLTYKQLSKAVATFHSLISFALQDAMKVAIDKAAQHQAKKGVAMQDADKSGIADMNEDGKFDARDLFHLLNKDDDDVLSIDEFKNLFTELDIEMSDEKQDMLLAICDIDGSGTIDEEEFVNAWDYFQMVFVEEAAAQAGVGYWHVAVTVAVTVLMVFLLFVFIFLAMAAWSNEDNFVTVIRSLIITVMGGVIGAIRPKRHIEDEEAYKKQVENSVQVFKGSEDSGDY